MSLEEQSVAGHSKNFWLTVLDGAIYLMAMAVVPVQTLLPAYLHRYTSNEYIINMIPALAILGFSLPQIAMARQAESLTHRKRIMLVTGAAHRAPWLLLGLAVLLFPGATPGLAIALFLVLFATHTFATGVHVPIWLDLVAKLVPVGERGRLFAWRNVLGGLLGLAGAGISRIVLQKLGFPQNYGVLFLMFFALAGVSFMFACFLDEPPSVEVKEKQGFLTYLRRIPDILTGDTNYRNFVIARLILAASNLAGGLVAVYGIQRFNLQGREYIFADIAFLTTLVCLLPAFIFARLGDRYGHKLNLLIASVLSMAAMLLLLFMRTEALFTCVFILQGLSMSAQSVSGLNFQVEFGREADRPTYIAVLNTVCAPVSFAAPLLGAWLARLIGYPSLFWIVISILILHIAVFAVFVREPRHSGRVSGMRLPEETGAS